MNFVGTKHSIIFYVTKDMILIILFYYDKSWNQYFLDSVHQKGQSLIFIFGYV